MAYQVPGAHHPWRQYRDRALRESKDEAVKEKIRVTVKQFISDLVEGWDNAEIVTTDSYTYEEGRFKLSELSQSKQAAWLANILKKNYGN